MGLGQQVGFCRIAVPCMGLDDGQAGSCKSATSGMLDGCPSFFARVTRRISQKGMKQKPRCPPLLSYAQTCLLRRKGKFGIIFDYFTISFTLAW